MASYNRVILLGNLTRDPQVRFTPNKTAVCDFWIATNRMWKSQSGEQKNEICFVDCTIFGKRAEVIGKYFKKGSTIFIEGRLTLESWQGQDGIKKSKLKVTVENFEFVGKTESSESDPAAGQPEPDDEEIPF